MQVTIVHVHVKLEWVAAFIDATRKNHEASVQEQSNLCFDVIQSKDAPSCLVLYEAYASEEAAIQHKQTAHYLAWRNQVAEWMAGPRKGIHYRGLFPVQ